MDTAVQSKRGPHDNQLRSERELRDHDLRGGNQRGPNPQLILERGETVELLPLLVKQGGLDDNVLLAFQVKFGETYRAAGGDCEVEIFDGCGHLWVQERGPETGCAHELVKAFIARRRHAQQQAA